MKNKLLKRLKEIQERGLLKRMAEVGAIDEEARTVELSFSSEVEVERWFGIEILGHAAGEVDMSRLNDKAPVLWMHNWDDQRGVVDSASVADRKGRALLRFSRSEDGSELFQDIIDGIVTKVSVGYLVNDLKLVEERDGVDVYRITNWQPYEISMVSVPADNSVGVGRSAEKPQVDDDAGRAENADKHSKRGIPVMKEKILRDGSGNLVRAKVDDDGKILEVLEIIERAGTDVTDAAKRGADSERTRVRELTELGRAYNATEKALQFIADGKTAADLQRELLHDFAEQRGKKPMSEQEKDADIGMSDKEVRSFSIMRAIRALANPQDAALRKAAAFEFEASAAAAERYGKNPKGIIIPNDVLSRAFSTTSPTAGPGSALVATELLSGSFIELLRKKAWVMRRARTLGGLVGNVDIPRQNAAGSAYWVGEGGAPTAGEPGVDQIALTPKTVGAYTDITRRLMMQATPDAEALVRDDLLQIISLEIDRVAIYGTGSSNQPKGVRNYTGINAVDFASSAAPTFAELVAMETAIANDDADVDAMSYAFNAAIRGHMKTTTKFGTGTSHTIWEDGNTVNGYEVNVSNQIASGDVFFANWQDLIIAMWGGLELTVDPYALSTSGGVRLVALQDIDLNLRHLESFCWGSSSVA
jgi:HK97 family phage major capsid protein/HK97 family phage prohead protease